MDGLGTTETHHYKTDIDLRQHVPNTNAREYLVGMADFFGLGIIIEGRNVRLVAKKDVMIDNEQVNWVSKSLAGYTISYEKWEGAVYFSELDEKDLLNESPALRDDPFNSLIGEVADVASLPGGASLGDTYLVIDTNKVYQFDGNGNWADQGYYNVPVEIAPAEADRISIISGTQIYSDTWHGAYTWRIPHVEVFGNSDPYARMNFGFGNRLMFYRGKVTDDPHARPLSQRRGRR